MQRGPRLRWRILHTESVFCLCDLLVCLFLSHSHFCLCLWCTSALFLFCAPFLSREHPLNSFFFEDDKFILNCTNSLLTLHYNSNLKITKHRQPQVLSSSWVLFYVVIQAEQVAATVWELNKDRALKPETPPLFSQPVWQQGTCECFALQNISLLPTMIIQKNQHWGAILNSFNIAFSSDTNKTRK